MSNHLINETSPYLIQHAENPVDWYPWGEEALSRGKSEDKPRSLSIGYSACHWCHVMENESFEDPETAAILNENFVCIKVDREQNPDLDHIYMEAVIAMNGQGGWPMSVFLTPQLKPFYGGTYFPPTPRYKLPAFKDVLITISQNWDKNRQEIFSLSERLFDHLVGSGLKSSDHYKSFNSALVVQAINSIQNQYDDEHGGWGDAPKFPLPGVIDLLMVQSANGDQKSLEMVKNVLWAMIRGGFYDLLGGGFHRYCTDENWLIPHFEKMLYDNTQLASTYLYGYLLTGENHFKGICQATLDFMLNEMQDPNGGFYSSIDADSEGDEGKFYLWELVELESLLTKEELGVLNQAFEISSYGNFDGKIILRHTDSFINELKNPGNTGGKNHSGWEVVKSKLFDSRNKRIHPNIDHKILTSWNALAMTAFANAGRYLNRPDYLAAAQKLANFLLYEIKKEKTVYRCWYHGHVSHPGYLEDYSGLILALFSLYQADQNPKWFSEIKNMISTMMDLFYENGDGFFDTSRQHKSLLFRPKNNLDNVTPSGSSMAVYSLLLHSAYTGEDQFIKIAEKCLKNMQPLLSEANPLGYPFWLKTLGFAQSTIKQVVITWPDGSRPDEEMINIMNSRYLPNLIFAASPYPVKADSPQIFHDRKPISNKTTAFVCEGFVCRQPIISRDEFFKILYEI